MWKTTLGQNSHNQSIQKEVKPLQNYLEVKQKGEDDFGNSTGDKNTRIEISKRTKNTISFSKAKKKGKSIKFSGKFISLPTENSWELWSKVKTGIRIL